MNTDDMSRIFTCRECRNIGYWNLGTPSWNKARFLCTSCNKEMHILTHVPSNKVGKLPNKIEHVNTLYNVKRID